MRTIVIVGGGYCGTTLATMLLRRPPATPTRLVLIERGVHVGRGVAFAARDFPYLLNVPAGRMSANPADPLEFLRFMQRREPGTDAESFLPRAWYGDYLESFVHNPFVTQEWCYPVGDPLVGVGYVDHQPGGF